jgi:hypothetical protein
MGGVRPNASENGQISGSNVVRNAWNAGTTADAQWLPENPVVSYHSRRSKVHMGNVLNPFQKCKESVHSINRQGSIEMRNQEDKRKREAEIRLRVVEEVKTYWQAANFQRVEINDQNRDFLRGTLYFVSIFDAGGVEHENYVYVKGDKLTRFDNAKELARAVGKNITVSEYLENLFASTGVSGVIAIIITITICFLAFTPITGNEDILKILGLSLTTILGFYFGTAHSSINAKNK